MLVRLVDPPLTGVETILNRVAKVLRRVSKAPSKVTTPCSSFSPSRNTVVRWRWRREASSSARWRERKGYIRMMHIPRPIGFYLIGCSDL